MLTCPDHACTWGVLLTLFPDCIDTSTLQLLVSKKAAAVSTNSLYIAAAEYLKWSYQVDMALVLSRRGEQGGNEDNTPLTPRAACLASLFMSRRHDLRL